MTSTDDAMTGTFRWIPATENGPTMPTARPKLSGFAYVEPHRDVEGAILLQGDIPDGSAEAAVEARWLPGYRVPDTKVGDAIVVVASQRPIARVTVTDVKTATLTG